MAHGLEPEVCTQGLRPQIPQTQLALVRERVVAGQREVQRVFQQLYARHVLLGEDFAGELEQQGEVELARPQPRNDLGGLTSASVSLTSG